MQNIIRNCAAIAALALSSSAQVLEAGWTSTLTPLPNAVQAVHDLPGPGVVYYDGTALVLDDGMVARQILALANPPAFASFTIAVGPDAVLFGESTNGELWFVPLDGASTPRLVTTLPFNYDAIALSGSTVLVSAKSGGFGAPDNELIAVDLASGATDLVAIVPGYSGPLALDRDGGVVYATSQLGSADLVRFAAAQIASAFGPGHLTIAQATTLYTGLPSATQIAVDDDGDVLVGDFTGPALLEVSLDPLAPPRVSTLVAYPPGAPSAAALTYHTAPDHAAFEPFQPALGKSLTVVETQFGGAARIRTIRPARPVTAILPAAPVPAGSFTIRTTGGPAQGLGVVLFAMQQAAGAPLALPGIEQPLFVDVSLGTVIASVDVSFDAAGTADLAAFNTGFANPVEFAVQCAFVTGAAGGATIAGTAEGRILSLAR